MVVGPWFGPLQLWISLEMIYFEVTEMAFPSVETRCYRVVTRGAEIKMCLERRMADRRKEGGVLSGDKG